LLVRSDPETNFTASRLDWTVMHEGLPFHDQFTFANTQD